MVLGEEKISPTGALARARVPLESADDNDDVDTNSLSLARSLRFRMWIWMAREPPTEYMDSGASNRSASARRQSALGGLATI